jgi:hypothetical protein
LAVKFGMHRFLLGLSLTLLHNINNFEETQKEASHPYANIVKKPF